MKKGCLFFLIVILVTFISFAKILADEDVKDLPLLGKVIYIDPGHGGRDSGTSYNGILEKNLNLEISLILREKLGKKGSIVYMTRDADEDLSSIYDIRKKRADLYRRIKKISDESLKTDIYLSIHINWYNNSYWRGAEVLYNKINPQNKILANIIMKHFSSKLNTSRTLKETDLYMYKNTRVPGVLIECGFLSNPIERELLQNSDYQHKITETITSAVTEYFGSS